MTAIIYEIKHNSALRQVGQLSRSLSKSPLFSAHNDLDNLVQYRKWHLSLTWPSESQ